MSETIENEKQKISSLISNLSKLGFKSDDKIGKAELIKYLDSRSCDGKFDQVISDKLFQVLNLDDSSSIPVKDFVSGFLQFEEDITKNTEKLFLKYKKEKEKYDSLIQNSDKKLESYTDAKILGEITEIDLKDKLEGTEEIIMAVIFNDKKEEFRFKIGETSLEKMEHKKFEFTPTSREDHFELIIQGINTKKETFDIGKKEFPLKDVKSTEKYLVKIFAPEAKKDKKISAHINAKIIIIWNDLNYEQQKKRLELKLKKLEIACKNAQEYLRKVITIYNIPSLLKEINNLFNKDFLQVLGSSSLVDSSQKISNQVENDNNQPRDKDEDDEENSTGCLGYYKNELKFESKRINDLKKDYINNINNINDANNANNINNANNENYNEYPLNTDSNNGENINTNIDINQENEIYNSEINVGMNQQGLNENIYESDVKTIPIIIGQSQVSNEQNYEGLNYDNNLIQQSNIQENLNENTGYIQNSQMDNYTQNSQIDNYTQNSQIDTYTQNAQMDSYSQLNQEANYTQNYTENVQIDNYSQLNQGENYSQLNQGANYTQLNQGESYTQLNEAQNYTTENSGTGYNQSGPYQVTNYQSQHRRYTQEIPQSYIQMYQTKTYRRTSYVPNYSQQLNQLQAEYGFTPINNYNQTHNSAISSLNGSQIISSSAPYYKKYYHVKL